MASNIPALPSQYKSLNHCLKIAAEHDIRDPVVAYWCRFYAVQQGLTIDRSSPEAKQFLIALMDWLEKRKKELHDNEAITNEAVAEAHLENYILRIFNWADSQDRAGVFNKNVIKTFYTAGILIDVLTNFNKGELSEEFQNTRKYAKWKAAYINNCLKNGETPHAGPLPSGEGEENNEEDEPSTDTPQQSSSLSNASSSSYLPPGNWSTEPSSSFGQTPQPLYPPSASQQPTPSNTVSNQYNQDALVTTIQGPVPLSVSDINKAAKYCKWAGASLNFDDVPTAITNLEKALHLLKTGQDLG